MEPQVWYRWFTLSICEGRPCRPRRPRSCQTHPSRADRSVKWNRRFRTAGVPAGSYDRKSSHGSESWTDCRPKIQWGGLPWSMPMAHCALERAGRDASGTGI